MNLNLREMDKWILLKIFRPHSFIDVWLRSAITFVITSFVRGILISLLGNNLERTSATTNVVYTILSKTIFAIKLWQLIAH